MNKISLKEEIQKLKNINKERTPNEIKQIFSRAITEPIDILSILAITIL